MSNRFVFVAPMFNASTTLARMLHSICGQSYDNWKIILIDDCSSEEERAKCSNILYRFKSLVGDPGPVIGDIDRKIVDLWNSEKRWEVANVLWGLNDRNLRPDDIICRIDADDWMSDLDALAIIDSAYQETGCDALWTMHRWGFSDKCISGPMPQGADPYRHPWVSSHLKTFRKRLLNDVKDANYRGEDGEYIRRAGDQAIYLPALYKAQKHVFLPRTLYHYNIKDVPETYQTSDARFQRDEALFLRSRGFVE